MKMKFSILLLTLALTANLASAQANAPAPDTSVVHTNLAIVPERHEGARTDAVLQRAKQNPGACDIVFIGDSITQGWEGGGKKVWEKYYGHRKCLNLGVSGDRTQHVLWRFEQGQLDGLKPKIAVVMIGTNNSNNNKDGTEQFTTAEILEGVDLIVKQLRERLPGTKIILNGIFPRGKNFNAQRGKLLQVNQALEKLADGKNIFYIDFGSQLIEADGSISPSMMRDALHPGERGYEIWAAAIEPKVKELLAK